MRVMHIVGARPNFIKAAPVIQAMNKLGGFRQTLLHTGQHYDRKLSKVFFEELELPEPDVNLGVGSASHSVQTAEIMQRFEPAVKDLIPDWVLVYGDVNSTLASALVCSKLPIKVAHVEAGLRSFDRTMPEEINRLLVDQISDLLFTPSRDAGENLLREGVSQKRIHFVGNVMIDTLKRLLPRAEERWPSLCERLHLSDYILATLHRPSNVDEPHRLRKILKVLDEVSRETKVFLPVHPRTRARIDRHDLAHALTTLRFVEPMGYLDFVALQSHARLVITDSGGMQEETTWLGVPCLTVRSNTERPITIEQGTNQLFSGPLESFYPVIMTCLTSSTKEHEKPDLWDGNSAERIARALSRV